MTNVCDDNDGNILKFDGKSSALLDTETYTGLYFSKGDMPYAFEFDYLKLVKIGPGVFEGQDKKGTKQSRGGHKIHTEKNLR